MITRRVAMAVGDTAGHVMPALAIAEAYRDVDRAIEVSFLAAGGPASRIVPRAGYALFEVPALPLARVGLGGKLRAALAVPRTIQTARRALRTTGARLVIGTGGYASGGVLLAARSLGLQTAIVELNVEPGLANRLLGRVVSRHYVAYEEAARRLPAGRSMTTGPLVRPSLARRMAPKSPPSPDRPVRLLVTGGSRGDAFLAAAMPAVAAALRSSGLALEVHHQVATLDPAPVALAYSRAGVKAVVSPFIEDIADAYAWADVAVARAGAGTLAELAVAGLPALLVPLADAAEDHQTVNAAAYAARGAARLLQERDWEPARAADILHEVFGADGRWTAMSNAARALGAADAAMVIVRDCEQAMAGRW